MNCLEFHRTKLADPHRLPREAQAHLAECAACTTFAASVDESERELQQAVATPVPEGLADRVLLRVHGRRRPWHGWALAASVVLAVAIASAALLYRMPGAEHYARTAIEHVAMEPESLSVVDATNVAALGELIRASGGRLKEPLGAVRYVRLCPVENATALHVVFETSDGLATLLIVPGHAPARLERARSARWSALARPAGKGYYAVVASSAEQTASIDRLVRSRIDWGA